MWWWGQSPNHHIYGPFIQARGVFITLLVTDVTCPGGDVGVQLAASRIGGRLSTTLPALREPAATGRILPVGTFSNSASGLGPTLATLRTRLL